QVFSTLPSAQALGVAIGNVASHEAGHLLGLNHVNDDAALMDDRSAADVFLSDQEFKEAPLSNDIMVIGTQDAVLLLDETVGPFPF
ncbi:MAG: matrixin family metalloprotease, partial [Planctomycetes bacterium]|nr:matrixin family metalloprotease [Planctomycetota bacterium]